MLSKPSLIISSVRWVCSEPFAFSPSSALLLSAAGSHSTNNLNALIDLAGLDVTSTPPPLAPPAALPPAPSLAPAEIPILPPPPQALVQLRGGSSGHGEPAPAQQSSAASSLSLLDEELLCLGRT